MFLLGWHWHEIISLKDPVRSLVVSIFCIKMCAFELCKTTGAVWTVCRIPYVVFLLPYSRVDSFRLSVTYVSHTISTLLQVLAEAWFSINGINTPSAYSLNVLALAACKEWAITAQSNTLVSCVECVHRYPLVPEMSVSRISCLADEASRSRREMVDMTVSHARKSFKLPLRFCIPMYNLPNILTLSWSNAAFCFWFELIFGFPFLKSGIGFLLMGLWIDMVRLRYGYHDWVIYISKVLWSTSLQNKSIQAIYQHCATTWISCSDF